LPCDIPWKEHFLKQKRDYKEGHVTKPVTKFKNMSELADVVMYQIFRVHLLELVQSEDTKKRKDVRDNEKQELFE